MFKRLEVVGTGLLVLITLVFLFMYFNPGADYEYVNGPTITTYANANSIVKRAWEILDIDKEVEFGQATIRPQDSSGKLANDDVARYAKSVFDDVGADVAGITILTDEWQYKCFCYKAKYHKPDAESVLRVFLTMEKRGNIYIWFTGGGL